MYPTNTFGSATFRNISSDAGIPTVIFDSNVIPSGGHAMILSIVVANKSGTTRNVNMTLQKAGSANPAHLLFDVAIPTQNAFEIISGNKFVIQRGDTLRLWGDADSTNLLDAVVSYVVYTPAV
jgi:hypothetical protein